MKQSAYLNTDERLAKIETGLSQIKTMLKEALSLQKNNHTTAAEKIQNVNEVAEFTGIEKHPVYAKCASGEIPCFRIGKLYKFKRSEIEQWMKKQGLPQKVDVEDYVNRYLQTHILKG